MFLKNPRFSKNWNLAKNSFENLTKIEILDKYRNFGQKLQNYNFKQK